MPTENRSSNTEMVSELLPCPFCKAAMRIESNRDWHRVMGDHDDECVFMDPETMMVPATDEQRELLVRDWNRRTQPAEQHQGEPVALPMRKDPTQHWVEPCGVAKADGWNACLDELAKLGSIYTHPAPAVQKGEPVAPWYYYANCADPDYSCLFHHENEAQTQVADHGGTVEKLWNAAPHADAGEVERLRAELKDLRESTAYRSSLVGRLEQERDTLRAQMAERDALLREAMEILKWDESGTPSVNVSVRINKLLSASAEPIPRCPNCGYTYQDCREQMDHYLCGLPEPSAPKDWCTTMARPKSKCGCPDCGSSIVQMSEPSVPKVRITYLGTNEDREPLSAEESARAVEYAKRLFQKLVGAPVERDERADCENCGDTGLEPCESCAALERKQ